MTVDDWIAQRVRLRRTANYQGEDTWNASRGTEHLKVRSRRHVYKIQFHRGCGWLAIHANDVFGIIGPRKGDAR